MSLSLLRAKETVEEMLDPFGQRGRRSKSPQTSCKLLPAPHHVLLQLPPQALGPRLVSYTAWSAVGPALPPGPHCLWEKQMHWEPVQCGGNITSSYCANGEHGTSILASPAS